MNLKKLSPTVELFYEIREVSFITTRGAPRIWGQHKIKFKGDNKENTKGFPFKGGGKIFIKKNDFQGFLFRLY